MSTINLPVNIQTMYIHQLGLRIYYPQVVDLMNIDVQQRMNRTIIKQINTLIREQYKQQNVETFAEMIGTYEVKANERNVLSLTFTNYAYAPYHAHGLTLMKSLTFDVQSGKNYRLDEMFKPNSSYVNELSEIIKKQISERQIVLINKFSKIAPYQDYYVADQILVLYFQVYDITPYYFGIPLFPIPVYQLEHILIEDRPLGKMLGG